MKWRLTGHFLMSVMSIVIMVIFVNAAIAIVFLLFQYSNGLNHLSEPDGVDFTRAFADQIEIVEGVPTVSEEGVEQLERRNAWVQLLDRNGEVLNSFLTPEGMRTHYSPVELIHVYKYNEDVDTTLYIGEKEEFSYLVGINNPNRSRIFFTYNPQTLFEAISKYALIILLVDLVIAALVGLLFGSILTRPIYFMMAHIEKLKNRDFSLAPTKKTGIYTKVFRNLNDVSENLQSYEEERNRLEKMRSEWVSNVSHDLKTPLASIQGYAELLRDQQVMDDERLEYAAVIERQAIYMRDLLEDFNLTMRLREHKLPLHKQPTRLANFTRELVIDLLNDPQFGERSIQFVSEADQLVADVDQHLLKRALLNFIYNALIHNDDQTSVIITVTREEQRAKITIQDNGKGMSPEQVAQVFERYYRGTNTEDTKGSGLGTAIARDIIEAHGGQVSFESMIGEGSIVTILL